MASSRSGAPAAIALRTDDLDAPAARASDDAHDVSPEPDDGDEPA